MLASKGFSGEKRHVQKQVFFAGEEPPTRDDWLANVSVRMKFIE